MLSVDYHCRDELLQYEEKFFLEHFKEQSSKQKIATVFYLEVIDFIEYLLKEKQYSLYTVDSYLIELNQFILELITRELECVSWEDLNDNQVRTVLRGMGFNQENKKVLSARSRAHLVSTLKSFYKYEVKYKKISNNFMLNIEIPKFKAHLPQYLTNEQFEKLVELPPNPTNKQIRDRAIIELLYSTGIRVSELVNIKLEDINFYEYEIRIVGKGNKERVVIFGSYAIDAIQQWLKCRDSYNPNSSHLFVNRFGDALTTRAIQIMLKNLGEELSLPIHVSPHKLRHSFATEMVNNGADLRVVQELLGHASLGVTQVYLHLDIKKMQEIYNKSHPLAKEDKD